MIEKIQYQYFYTTRQMINTKGVEIVVKQPRVTVCYLRMTPDAAHPEPWTAVGIAICSLSDPPCKKVGRAIAKQRAIHATTCNRLDLPMRVGLKVGLAGLSMIMSAFGYKALVAEQGDFRFASQHIAKKEQS